ncbi:MAG: hypothetical protein ACLFWB_06350, partial [Armatimonadota bacterium]
MLHLRILKYSDGHAEVVGGSRDPREADIQLAEHLRDQTTLDGEYDEIIDTWQGKLAPETGTELIEVTLDLGDLLPGKTV